MYKAIKTHLDAEGKTFADLSRQTGIRETVFANLKARGGSLSLGNAIKVADALGVRLEELVKEPAAV